MHKLTGVAQWILIWRRSECSERGLWGSGPALSPQGGLSLKRGFGALALPGLWRIESRDSRRSGSRPWRGRPLV